MEYTEIKHLRSSEPGLKPTTQELDFGVVAINTYDGNLFFKKDDGTGEVIVESGHVLSVNGSGGDVVVEPSGTASTIMSQHVSAYDHTKIHDVVTVSNSDSINLSLNNQSLSASVNYNLSSGVVGIEPTFSVSGLNITISSCVVSLYSNSTFKGYPKNYIIPQLTLTSLPNTTSYIYADYNNGIPCYKISTDVNVVTESDTVPINTIITSDGYVHLSNWDALGDGLVNKLHRRFVKTQRFARESGLTLSVSGTNAKIEAGVVWRGARAFNLLETNSNGTNSSLWFLYTHINGTWSVSAGAPAFNNTQYNDASGLLPLNGVRCNINWIFRGVEDHQHGYYVLSDIWYKDVATARAETKIPVLPSSISTHAILVGRMICEYNNPVPIVENLFDQQFISSAINDHNTLSGLQGGLPSEYYHLTNSEHLNLQSVSATTEPTGYVVPGGTAIGTWGGTNNRVLTFVGTDEIFHKGTKYSKSNYSVDLNVLAYGKWFGYWEPDLVLGGIKLSVSQTSWLFDNAKVPAIILYNSPTTVDFGEERHGCRMDVDTHARLHSCDGAVIENGGLKVTCSNTAPLIKIDSGAYWDEDLKTVCASSTQVGVSYFNGSYYDRTGLTTQYFSTSGSATPQYAKNNGSGVYIPTDVTNGYFSLYFILGTHRKATPIISLMHTEQYETISLASIAQFNIDIKSVINTNSSGAEELVVLACVIVENIDGVANFVELYDRRNTTPKIRQNLNAEDEVFFKDVYLNNLAGVTIGNSNSVKTALLNIDHAISEAVYYPVLTTPGITGATIAGNALSLQTLDSSIAGSVTITETTGSPFTSRVKIIVGDNTFNLLQFACNYMTNTGGVISGHNIQISIINANGTSKTNLYYYNSGVGEALTSAVWENKTHTLASYSDYVQSPGVSGAFVEIEILHSSNGLATHRFYIDKVALIKASASTTPPDATDSVKGIVELATLAETVSGVNTSTVITPSTFITAINSLTNILSTPYNVGTVDANTTINPVNGKDQYVTIGSSGTLGITLSFIEPSDLTKSFVIDLRIIRSAGNQRVVTIGGSNFVSSGGLFTAGVDIFPSSGASAIDFFQIKWDAAVSKYMPINALYDIKA